MSDQGPTVFNGRYELHRQLARGGMADVFLARDQLLDRPVAIKVLFAEFATDPAFVERFKREAQAAANLSHPNVVSIYDWGEERGTYFIVMEYVEGRSLADIIRAEGPLHPDRAAEIGIDVAAALGFAHRNGLVHRDVKPGNVLIDPQGHVKVADFGIATAIAGAQSELTQAGTVMGTATYFSPEQAQGQPVDPRSDIYSLGVVLYEMLSGRPPFAGETPVAIAYQHVQDQPVSLRARGVPVAESLEAITFKALAKSPANRYPSAEDLRSDLRRYSEGAHELSQAAAAAAAAKAAEAPVGERSATGPAPQVPQPGYEATAAVPAVSNQTTATPTMAPAPPAEPYYAPQQDDGAKRMFLFGIALIGLLVLLVFLAIQFADTLGFGDDSGDGDENALFELPSVIGDNIDEARQTLEGRELKVIPELIENEEVPENEVFGQSPEPGVKVRRGDTITLQVSGAGPREVPNVLTKLLDEATAEVRAAGFEVEAVPEERDDITENEVFDQQPPAGETLEPGAKVTLRYSAGPGVKEVPSVVGSTQAAAVAAITRAGFDFVIEPEASAEVDEDRVIRTDPVAGTALEGGLPVTIVVSTGAPSVNVPSVIDLRTDSAIGIIESNGLEAAIRSVPVTDSSQVNRVLNQTPRAGTAVAPGTEVSIEVGELTQPPPTTGSTPPPTTSTAPP